ncbi:zinc finger BED domain-containing protein RICESLEEPER 2-like [Triticum urartu]|uniref:zinc finger BED domain-containing protein RICESLEEPER 2-like n=1 Tax=Triticum urartu TaxID=4572 RepID=UPI0020439648|nr:zinc finger BED domain-containing protein RICESLEEPER 2-like [Triticum urartu]
MIVLHEYPLSIVDHTGFRRFVSALQPLFSMVTRNTIRKDILYAYKVERKKAIEYMAANRSRVAITTDLWTADNQKKGYMAIMGHFIDDSWKLRSVIMRFIYVPAPHTAEVIAEELHESLISWNLDEKLSTVTIDNCSSNDKTIDLLVKRIGKDKLML